MAFTIFRVIANPEEPPKIDWSYYKNNSVNKAVIEQFEKLYASTKIPYPDDKGAYASVAAEEKNEVRYWSYVWRFSRLNVTNYVLRIISR